MRYMLAVFSISLLSQAAVTSVQVDDAARQQGIVTFRVTDPAQCTVTVYRDAALTRKIEDTDNTVFAGSESCIRPFNVYEGNKVTAVVGRRVSERALDGKLHSRSLEVNQTYYAVISDVADHTAVTAQFTTTNIPWGDTHIELPQSDNTAFFGWAWPDLDWSDAGQSKSYVDPLTGVAFTRTARNRRGEGGPWGNAPFEVTPFNAPLDVRGTWTNIANIRSTSPAGPFGSYSGTSQDAVVLTFDQNTIRAFSPSFPADSAAIGQASLDDVALTIFGTAPGCTGADCNVLACLVVDYTSADTCAGPEITVTLPSGAATGQIIPASYPAYQFNGWNLGKYINSEQHSISSGALATVTSSSVVLGAGQFLPMNAASGFKIHIGSNWYTIGAIKTAAAFTLQESGVNTSGAWYMGNFGVRIRKATATNNTVNVAAGYSYVYTYLPNNDPNQENRDYYSPLTFPVTYEANGTTPLVGCIGRLSVQGSGYQTLMLIVNPCAAHPAGETRFLGPIAERNGFPTLGGFSSVDPFTIVGVQPDPTDPGGGTSFWRTVYDPTTCKFSTWGGNGYNRDGSIASDCINLTNVTSYAANPNLTIKGQIMAALVTNPMWDASLSFHFTLGGISGNYAVMGQWVESQDSPCYMAVFELTNFTLVKLIDSFTGSLPGYRWSGCHSNGLSLTDHAGIAAFDATLLGTRGATGYLAGPFELPAWTSKSLDGGTTWSTDTSLLPGTLINTSTAAGKCGPIPQWVVGSQCVDLTNAAGPCGANSLGVTGYRCVKLKAPQDQPCQLQTATTAASTKWPCSWNPAANHSGGGMTVQAGDYISRGSPSFDGKNEKMRVINKTSDGAGGWIFELERWTSCDNPWSDKNIAPPACLYYDHLYTGRTGNTHDNGWTSFMPGPMGSIWFDLATPASSTTWKADASDITAGGHNAVGMAPDNIGRVLVGNGAARTGPLPAQASTPPQHTFNIDSSSFGGIVKGTNNLEVYPTTGNWTSPTVQQRSLYYDWRHTSPDAGISGDNPVKLWNHTYALAPSQQWTYKVDVHNSLGATAVILKTRPPNVWSSRVGFRDISGPSSVINDAIPNGSYCVAYKAGECVSGSSVGDVYAVAKGAWIEYGGCLVNSLRTWTPCVSNLESNAAWMIQGDTQQDDPLGTRFRRITMGLTGPAAQYGYTSPRVTPDGALALVRPSYLSGMGPDMMALKIPPPAMTDSIDRSNYVQVAVALPAGSGYARVRFGYAENGAASQFFCTTRQEACLTDATQIPFAWEQSDTLTGTDCRAGCTINIPALSGRVLYYRIEKSPNGTGGWVSSLPQVKAVK